MRKIVFVIFVMFCVSANASFERNAERTLLDFQGICLSNINSLKSIQDSARKLRLKKAIGIEGVIGAWYGFVAQIAIS